MSAHWQSKFEVKLDKMGELHNTIASLIMASELPTSEVLMVLQMLISDCEGNFRSQVKLLEIQRSKKDGNNLQKDSL